MPLNFMPFALKMTENGVPDIRIEAFRRNFIRAFGNHERFIREASIAPVGELPVLDGLEPLSEQREREIMKKCAVLKLNGGLATTMGKVRGPKSLITARGKFTFLDIAIRRILTKRRRFGQYSIPLILFNSFSTAEQTMKSADAFPELYDQRLQLSLLQSMVPRIDAAAMLPYSDEGDLDSEWCPPGHGDIYMSFFTSGILSVLLSQNIRWLFVSNIDNLGAELDARIAGWMEENELPMVMEVCRRCPADCKGGHLCRDVYGGFVLRESSMCAPDELAYSSDIDKYRYFNTNNIWLNVEALYELIVAKGGFVNMPVIVNCKKITSSQGKVCDIIQLENACGSLISAFPNAQALEVGRERFAPVKGLGDLATVRSDVFSMEPDFTMRVNCESGIPPRVTLPPEVCNLADFEAMFPKGVPSLRGCRSLTISGPVVFGKNIRCSGNVSIAADGPETIADGAVLSGSVKIKNGAVYADSGVSGEL